MMTLKCKYLSFKVIFNKKYCGKNTFILTHKTSLTPPPVIEVSISS